MKVLTEQRLVESVRRGLDQSVSHLDWQTQAKLTRMRLNALEQHTNRPTLGINLASFSHGFAAAAVVTLVTALWLLPETAEMRVPSVSLTSISAGKTLVGNVGTKPIEPAASVMDVLMSTEDMEFLESLDMYEWLAAEYS